MSERYIKRTKKEKGKRKKNAIKYIKELSVGIKPIVDIALSLMIMRDLNVKKEKKAIDKARQQRWSEKI